MVYRKKVVEEDFEVEDEQVDSSSVAEDDFFDDDLGGDGEFDESLDDFDVGIKNQADVVKLWLDTEPYLNNIYLSLTNQQLKRVKISKNGKDMYRTEIVPITYKDENGVVCELKPLANNLGVTQIMAELKIYLSSPLVQGNLKEENYCKFMLWYEEQVTKLLWTNRIKWGIELTDVNGIYSKVVGSVGLFLTRPIGNLERGRERWNPNDKGQVGEDSGFFDKLAFWKKKQKMSRGENYG